MMILVVWSFRSSGLLSFVQFASDPSILLLLIIITWRRCSSVTILLSCSMKCLWAGMLFILSFFSSCRLTYVLCLLGPPCHYEQGWVSLAQFLSTKSDVSWCACLGGLPVCVIFVCMSTLCAWNLLSYHDIKRGCVLVYLLNRQILVHYCYRASRWSARVALALCFPLDSSMVFGCLA